MTKQTKLAIAFCIGCAVLFCISFAYFFTKAQFKAAKSEPPGISSEGVGEALPPAKLLGMGDAQLDDAALRKGKVVLAFVHPDCNACMKESVFLKTVVGQRDDVSFYGVIPFGDKEASLQAAQKKFPFKVFYDDGYKLGSSLQVTAVPIKLYVEDGVIKKVWEGASVDAKTQQEFVDWLTALE